MHNYTHHSASPIRAAAPGGADTGTRKPFWHRDQEASLNQRIAAINRINDPKIKTDNVLRWTTRGIYLLLSITAVIGGLNYSRFFGMSIENIYIVAFLTVGVTLAVEFGKYYCTTEAIRTAFFQGFDYIFKESYTTVIWVGLVLAGGFTLFLSAYNSTRGAEQLAYLVSHESAEGRAVFTPNTAELDAQILAAQNNQAAHNSNKWKGTIVWESAKASRAEGKNIAALLHQKDEVIAAQRADWDRHQNERRQTTDHAAGYILKIGGWLELFQLLLMFVKGACERALKNHPDALPHPTGNGTTVAAGAPYARNGTPVQNRIGFNLDNDGNVRTTLPTARVEPPPVTQLETPPFTVSQQNTPPALFTGDALLRHYESELRKEPSHLRRSDANANTVLTRIHQKLRNAHQDIDRTAPGTFSKDAAQRFGLYLDGVVRPLLHDLRPYSGLDDLIASLRHKTITDPEAVIA